MVDNMAYQSDVDKLKQVYASRARARYKHSIRRPSGNMYYEVRKRLGITQTDAARLINVTREAWAYRERVKLMYWPLELCILQRLSGMTSDEFIKLLNDIA